MTSPKRSQILSNCVIEYWSHNLFTLTFFLVMPLSIPSSDMIPFDAHIKVGPHGPVTGTRDRDKKETSKHRPSLNTRTISHKAPLQHRRTIQLPLKTDERPLPGPVEKWTVRHRSIRFDSIASSVHTVKEGTRARSGGRGGGVGGGRVCILMEGPSPRSRMGAAFYFD